MVSLLGNTLGLSLNIRWQKYHRDCNAMYLKKLNVQNLTALHIKSAGLGEIGNLNCSQLAKKIYCHFKNLPPPRMPTKQLPRDLCGQFSPEIFQALLSVSPVVEAYFNSYFQPYWIQIQENFPGAVSADTSFGWHIDDNPRQLMKIFIYLNDVTKDNGAFRAFSSSHSKQILRKGFISNSQNDRLKNQSIPNNYLKNNQGSLVVLEGAAGTILMFDNNLVHKGTAPETGYRHLVQIEIYPSMKKISQEQVYKALTNPIFHDYPPDPYFNDVAGN